ncbi:MAG: hypothetical protein RR886_05125 [Cellulosilyticaceae bacterium]
MQTDIANQAIEVLSSEMEEVDRMVANITRTIEELKEDAKIEGKIEVARALLDVLDDEMIAMKTGLSIEVVRKLREEM